MSTPQSTLDPAAAAGAPGDGTPPTERDRRRERSSDGSHARNYSRGFFVKLAIIAIVDALGVLGVMAAWAEGSYGILASMVALLVAANWAYFSKRALPMKYILPGLGDFGDRLFGT